MHLLLFMGICVHVILSYGEQDIVHYFDMLVVVVPVVVVVGVGVGVGGVLVPLVNLFFIS